MGPSKHYHYALKDGDLPNVEGYTPLISSLLEKERFLTQIKQSFLRKLESYVELQPVSCPIFLEESSGFNDNLNGIERPASFYPRDFQHKKLEIPHSMAKWKRWALGYYDFPTSKGLYVDFRGIRADDDLDHTHSLYCDQFDWEKSITSADRNVGFLQQTVRQIYKAIRETEQEVCSKLGITAVLPEEITFYSTDQAIAEMPNETPKGREAFLCQKYGAVFLMGIGGNLPNGELRHDGRAPDYDDWITPRPDGGTGLNGDILVWHPVLKAPFELSSMGVRVDADTMRKQLVLTNTTEREGLPWHAQLLSGRMTQSIGGGIGQSRLCMFMLRAVHVGEVQHGWWPPEVVAACAAKGIKLAGLPRELE
mmetsp:Transcript_21606/g.37112  ORF Transcript_21606/g.37112 Transcript_21606/m.37112 type:complete len:366 (+) Transcript_21606:77-1174(+)|eukprot:CAMPEP_0196659602 /NCGR_PEP_ID=MMETSP1086-20130531/35745_1 /TAXON_ID=77921 /ORGANISM="Cyanoptyche  gloeocystis , Strain SAG4.97" /LENGTH=365 /DNA_ID=CAMNT_0041993641 /DNA_START=58 /DNA_END=1155 /DNA_ORIENTATION=-